MNHLLATIIISIFVFSSTVTTRAQEIGDKLPELNVTDWILGDQSRVGKWGDGKVYILEIWGTWCLPCIKIMPELTKLQKEFGDKGLVVIGYSWEKPEILHKFVKENHAKIGYTIVGDTEEKTVGMLNENGAIQGFPYSFLVGPDGKILWKGNSKGTGRAVKQYFSGKPIDVDDGTPVF